MLQLVPKCEVDVFLSYYGLKKHTGSECLSTERRGEYFDLRERRYQDNEKNYTPAAS